MKRKKSKIRYSKEKMRKDLIQQKETLKNNFLLNVMRGDVKDLKYIEENFEQLGIFISQNGFQIITIEFNGAVDNNSEIILSQFIIKNRVEKILSTFYSLQSAELLHRISMIINTDENSIKIEKLQSQLQAAIELIDHDHGIRCFIGISHIHNNMGEIPDAYTESLEAVTNAAMQEDKNIFYAEDVEKLSNQYEFTIESEYRLINHIKTSNKEQAFNIIEEVVCENTKSHNLKIGYVQCLMFDIMGAIIRSVKEKGFSSMPVEKDPIRMMKENLNIVEMKQILLDFCSYACELNLSQKEMQKYNIEEDINQYIREHYFNPDLNVSMLGETFHLTPAYLSKIYKSETGNSLLYAINSIRIEASKKLLDETDLSVNQISKLVGYLYCNAFIRFFKKQTGLTPGQYKNLNKKQNKTINE
ncbi:MAG: helix-turn-helix transcriptional regulator [Paenibacillaceae bacterium]|nr:helix-turn-helix transcriptional regulator [Paenibacillaceae bacterium]